MYADFKHEALLACFFISYNLSSRLFSYCSFSFVCIFRNTVYVPECMQLWGVTHSHGQPLCAVGHPAPPRHGGNLGLLAVLFPSCSD